MFYPAFLYLNDLLVYKGWSLFDQCMSYGEVVFNTGMTGYQEIMTDPSYSGQIVIFTYPELGNTGLNNGDNESKKIHVKGIIARSICLHPYNWRSNLSLRDYIILKRIPHIFGVDTRSLTKSLRIYGVMKGCIISQSINHKYINVSFFKDVDLVKRVTTNQAYKINDQNKLPRPFDRYNIKYRYNYLDLHQNLLTIVILDFGVKSNIINHLLVSTKYNIHILPATTTYDQIRAYSPAGILLSNGPGDPSLVTYAINTVEKLVLFSNIPIFGICMGHQVLSLALGAKAFKLKFGHRGLNHPAGINQYSEITSQNHGFAVSFNGCNFKVLNSIEISQSILMEIANFNLNDSTISGIFMNNKPIFSVQYHPEASPGPHDSSYLFDTFIDLIQLVQSNIK